MSMRAAVLAVPGRDQQGGEADVLGTRQRRDAQQIEIVASIQGKQSRALDFRPDEIVVGQRRTVVAVGIRADVGRRAAARRVERAIRPLRGTLPTDANQLRPPEHVGHVPLVLRRHRELRKYLLIFDVAAALHPHALHGEIELRDLVRGNVVVVDAGAQELPWFPGSPPEGSATRSPRQA